MAVVRVDVDLDEFNDTELINELERRKYIITNRYRETNKYDIKQLISELRDRNIPENIIKQIEDHFELPLVSDDVVSLLKAKNKGGK